MEISADSKDRLETAVNRAFKNMAGRKKTAGTLYLLECCGFYKIGKTTDVLRRFEQYIQHNPMPLKVVAVISRPDYADKEAEFKNEYAHQQHRGEWFRLSPADLIEALENYFENQLLG